MVFALKSVILRRLTEFKGGKMDRINIVIDGKEVTLPEKMTILAAANSIGKKIPTLCHLYMDEYGYKNNCASCRVCVVEVKGWDKRLVPACATLIKDGMEIYTKSKRVLDKRKIIVELLLSDHPKDCLTCTRNLNCELQELAAQVGVREIRFEGERSNHLKDEKGPIIRDLNKCIMCRRCETVCSQIQEVGVFSAIGRGFPVTMGTEFKKDLIDTKCTFCGQCVTVCPVGALSERSNINQLIKDINDKEKTVVVQVAPAVRVAIGEEFKLKDKAKETSKMVEGLKMIGFDYVFDTNWGADLTIMEEASELKERLLNSGDKKVKLPLLTSCCPAWVRFVEGHYPELLGHLSSARSPQQMFGAVAKNIWALKNNIDKKNLVVVSIMPCIAKKSECERDEFKRDNIPDVDYSLTTRELGKLLKIENIDLKDLEGSDFDNPLGSSTGAAAIFGRTGGVIEAATRTAYNLITGKELENLDFKELRGFESIRAVEVDIDGFKVKIGVVHGLGEGRKILEMIKEGKIDLHGIEVMACKGGCIGGGGQPYNHGSFNLIMKRGDKLQGIDNKSKIRVSHKNEDIRALYRNELGEPLSKKAHDLLHTTYTNRKDK